MVAARNLTISGERLWATLMETAAFGATAKGGICRLALSEQDKMVRDWFVRACEDAGCTVTIDELGNLIARRPGRDNSLPPIAMGSHLDTQPTGGKFDGVLGVLAGLEIIRALNDAGYETNAPLEVISWTNEEGSRFAPAMLSSGVFAGVFDRDYAYERRDREGKSFGDELERIGYKGTVPCGGRKFGAFFELHIEQGPILEAEKKTIGIVTGVQGMRWYEVTVNGVDCHAGTTPMGLRYDALLGAARMIQAVNAVGLAHKDAVSTVGLIEARPNSRNVIPGEVFFTVDLRNPDDSVLAEMEKSVEAAIQVIAAESGLTATVNPVWNSKAAIFDADCVNSVRRAAADQGLPSRPIVSGAGHDAAYVARVAPTAMVFIPCENGISHNEIESAEPGHVTAGANVLLQAVLETDARLAEKAAAR